MAHPPNNRRSLAAPVPIISNPTGKSHPTTAANAAVYNLTNHFSRLNLNTKPTKSRNTFPQNPVRTHLQVKALSKSANLELSTQKIAKKMEREVSESDDNKSLVIVEVIEERKKKEGENEVVKPTMAKMVGGMIEKRGLYCDARVELGNFLATNCAKVVSADMPSFLQIHAVGFARKTKDSLEKFNAKSLALSLKKEFDGAYGPAWHCIVGTSFGSFVTHSVGGFLYFSLDQKLYILLFKTTVQRAD